MKTFTKWIPAIAVPVVVIAAGAIVVPLSASAAPNLPAKTPEQVVALLAGSSEDSFSGSVTVTSNLGLPDLSGLTGSSQGSSSSDSSASSYLDLLTGSHHARVYVDGATKTRVQVLDQLAERDVIRSGSDLWAYDSDKNAVVHTTAPAGKAPTSGTAEDPAALAKQAVAALEPTSNLAVTTAQTVAGRDAYTLVLTPKASGTLLGSVAIAVDAQTGLALSLSATATGENDPAWQVAFSSLDLATPSASLFEFTAPKDATVKEEKVPTAPEHAGTKHSGAEPQHAVTGTGWASVVEVTVGDDLADLTKSAQFAQLSTAVDGGRVVHTALVNILVTDDGKVLAGSVPVDTLLAAR